MDTNVVGATVSPVASVKKLSRLGVFGGLAIAVSVLESLIPQPLPWTRIGFANIIILIALYWDGAVAAMVVGALKVLGGVLVMGSGFSPAFWLALSGTAASLMVMIPLVHLPRWFSPVGVAIVGAAAFNTAQLFMAGMVLVGIPNLFAILPIMLIISVFTGAIIGWLAGWILHRLTRSGMLNGGWNNAHL
jgi:heptaprenyl diphosphate synthase